jgi:hypothetical protein
MTSIERFKSLQNDGYKILESLKKYKVAQTIYRSFKKMLTSQQETFDKLSDSNNNIDAGADASLDEEEIEKIISCSNIYFYKEIEMLLGTEKNIISIEKKFQQASSQEKKEKKVVVTIVSENGNKWIKINATNKNRLTTDKEFQDNIVKETRKLIEVGSTYIVDNNCSPQIVYHFRSTPPKRLISALNKLSTSLQLSYPTSVIPSNLKEEEKKENCVNLDITTLLALVVIKDVDDEKLSIPIILNNVIKEAGEAKKEKKDEERIKKITCQTAFNKFKELIDTIGSDDEKEKFSKLLEKFNIEVVPDQMGRRYSLLKPSRVLTKESIVIFSTGEFYNALNLTSNKSAVSKLRAESIFPNVEFHQPFSLGKEKRT